MQPPQRACTVDEGLMKTDKRPHSAGAYILLEGNRPHTT